MSSKTSEELLREHGFKLTTMRISLLDLFANSRHALSKTDLEKRFMRPVDRVTLYRNLKNFEKKGLIHSINDDSGETRYAICGEQCSDHRHEDDHIHFKCEKCRKIFCLRNSKFKIPPIGEGYKIHDYQIYVRGVCPHCS